MSDSYQQSESIPLHVEEEQLFPLAEQSADYVHEGHRSHAWYTRKYVWSIASSLLVIGLLLSMPTRHPSTSSPTSASVSVPPSTSSPLTTVTTLLDSQTTALVSHSTDEDRTDDSTSIPDSTSGGSILLSKICDPPYPGYPYCEEKVNWLQHNWNKDPGSEAYYRSQGVDGSKCSFLNYLNLHGFYCPEAADYNKEKIRGVNIGGWLVLEPWITPSLFEQFSPSQNVADQWNFCQALGKTECKHQLEKHWATWFTENDAKYLSTHGINHIRIPVGYWMFGDIRDDEPWVTGELPYLEKAILWAKKYNMHVVLDLHCGPGSQNGFDNSGRKGVIHWADTVQTERGQVLYPNIQRSLSFIRQLTQHFSQPPYAGTVVGIELINEAFITIPIEVVKDYYLQGYEIVKEFGDIAVIIGDSFRFNEWNEFMFPPHYRHVWIDTHIYQVFDAYRLSFTWQQHIQQTCTLNKPEVAVAPLSTMVGEWSLATTDCAQWLNGYNVGSRFDGTFPGSVPFGSCIGQDNIHNTTIWTPEYLQFLREWSQKQMDAYESGSSEGWFFWNFKTERAPQWDYMLGLREGWIPSDHSQRTYKC